MANAEPGERIRIVRDHIRSENAHDLAAVMETFGSSATYDDEPWDEHHVGRAAVQSFYEQLLRALPDLELAGERIYYDRATVLRQCGVFREPTSLIGRLLLFLNHPVTLMSASLRARPAKRRTHPHEKRS